MNSVEVFVEDLNRKVTLQVTNEELDRATTDTAYLKELVDRELNPVSLSLNASSSAETVSDSSNSVYIWKSEAVNLLLSLYEEYTDEFLNKRHKIVWDKISERMKLVDPSYDMSGAQCQSKLNGLKKTYKKIADHNSTSGNDKATWPFFNRMNEIFGKTSWAQPKAVASEEGPIPVGEVATLEPKPKKSKIENKVDVLLEEIKKSKEERKEERKIKEKNKENQFRQFINMKREQHQEKMEMFQKFFEKAT